MTTTIASPADRQNGGEDKPGTGNLPERLKAAGLDGEALPEDMDEFRRQLARCIYMFVNHWHGCPERICQRNRGCMAPSGRCVNVEVTRTAESWAETKFKVRQALDKRRAEMGFADE